jgi:hypothetical protein
MPGVLCGYSTDLDLSSGLICNFGRLKLRTYFQIYSVILNNPDLIAGFNILKLIPTLRSFP